jgi:hypothetical protein
VLTLVASIECAWGSQAAPSITSESATNAIAYAVTPPNVTPHPPAATLNATISPNGLDTTCQFEYVADTAFRMTGYAKAKNVSCSAGLGSSAASQGAIALASGLTPGTTYHFRVVATNADGTVNGADTTFQENLLEEVAHVGASLQNPNNFSLALDAADYVYVGDSATSNVLRMAPRGDRQPGADAPCVTVILSGPTVEGQPSPTPCLPPGSPPSFPFAGPKGIAISSDGGVYVTATGGSTNQCDNVVGIFPDGEVVELVNRNELGPNGQGIKDWNPAGIAVDEGGTSGVFVYATGPASNGATVRINPDRTFQEILTTGGQGLVVDADTGNVYVALPGQGVMEIPDARSGVCDVDGKMCPLFINNSTPTTLSSTTTTTTTVPGITTTTTTIPSPGNAPPSCDGQPITLSGPYGLALAGGILYVTGQDSNNVLRVPLRADNALGLPVCVEEIFSDGTGGLSLKQPRAIAADSSGNVYVAGALSNNIIWIRPAPADTTQMIPQEILNNTGINNIGGVLNKPEAVAVDSQRNVYVSANLDGAGTANVFRIRTVTAGLNPMCGDGKLETGEICDYDMDCCCSLNCSIQTERTVCRGSSGQLCDVEDICDGISPTCTDQFQTAGVECHTPNGGCDLASSCLGTGPTCPNKVAPAGQLCGRPAVNACDLPDVCDGSSRSCPMGQHNPCPAPLLAENVQDPCRENDCVPDSTDSGSHCVTSKTTLHCTGCQANTDCPAISCQQVSCEGDKCTYGDPPGFKYYTCVFDDPLPFKMSCPANPPKAIAIALRKIGRRNDRAMNLTNEAMIRCPDVKKSQAFLQHALAQLETDIVKVVVLGFAHHRGLSLSECVDDVTNQLELRAGRIRENLNKEQVGKACKGGAVAQRTSGSDPSVPEP